MQSPSLEQATAPTPVLQRLWSTVTVAQVVGLAATAFVVVYLPLRGYTEWPREVAAVAALSLAAAAFLLSEPDRRVPRGYYDTPRRFLVTGGASGIGLHVSRVLLARGHHVCVTDLNAAAAAQQCGLPPPTSNEGSGSGAAAAASSSASSFVRRLDVTQPDDWERVVAECCERFGSLDVCLNIAGFLAPHAVQDATVREIHLHVDVNLKGVVFGTRCAAKAMVARGTRGHIVNIASLGAVAPVSGVTMYIASKCVVCFIRPASCFPHRPQPKRFAQMHPERRPDDSNRHSTLGADLGA